MVAESVVASEPGITIDQAIEGLAFQGRANDVIEAIEGALGDASGDVWFYWSDGQNRLGIGVITRADSSRIDRVTSILQSAELFGRADLVKVVWSTQELQAAQERANGQLEALTGAPWTTARDPSANSIVIVVPDDLTAEQLKIVEDAVRAAGVSVLVETGASWPQLASV